MIINVSSWGEDKIGRDDDCRWVQDSSKIIFEDEKAYAVKDGTWKISLLDF